MNFNLKLFNTTETELKAIAALASIGFNSSPFIGNKTPAANGIPITLYINAQNKFSRMLSIVE